MLICPPVRLLPAAALTAMLMVAGGCATIGEDLAEIADSLTPVTASQAARWAIDTNDPDLRRRGIVLLGNSDIGANEPYVRLYRDYAQHETDPIVRSMAMRSLAKHGQPDDAQILAVNLVHEAPQVRHEAARGLQRLHNPKVVGAMLAVLRDEAEPADVRAAIATGLGQYPQDRVVQGLIGALDAWELSVNIAAERSLQTLTGKKLARDSRDWLSWYEAATERGDAFQNRQEYLFPTYKRDPSLFESMAFWQKTTFEEPAPPAGLRPSGQRGTYDDASADDGSFQGASPQDSKNSDGEPIS